LIAAGSDTNITLNLKGKGTGGAAVLGTSTNDNAASGYVGELISSVISSGSAVTMTRNTNIDVTSISLTAGDWDVWANINYITLGTSPTNIYAWTSSTSATTPDASLYNALIYASGAPGANTGLSAPFHRYSLSTTTTIYLTGALVNASGNGTACGGIYARRAR
jgi:hypothetical protein